jgi:hypothetical protein
MLFAVLQSHDLAQRIAEHDPASVTPAFADVVDWESIASANSEDSLVGRLPSLTGSSSDKSVGRSRGNSDPQLGARLRHNSVDGYSNSPLNSSDTSTPSSRHTTSGKLRQQPRTYPLCFVIVVIVVVVVCVFLKCVP